MFEAYGRLRGTGKWRPITWSGAPYRSLPSMLTLLVDAMRMAFPQNEYEVRPC